MTVAMGDGMSDPTRFSDLENIKQPLWIGCDVCTVCTPGLYRMRMFGDVNAFRHITTDEARGSAMYCTLVVYTGHTSFDDSPFPRLTFNNFRVLVIIVCTYTSLAQPKRPSIPIASHRSLAVVVSCSGSRCSPAAFFPTATTTTIASHHITSPPSPDPAGTHSRISTKQSHRAARISIPPSRATLNGHLIGSCAARS
ncbi:uncharacterized protein K489DRAFT_1139 [Dissoconium aciculare CBS 342.82]|uniref:Uncharacterized protein n=1 Tax=Dissoconium aciculare CBS 342.82 TaxID=1314786 RepID=A0A6J3MGU7_9PEZI|nr:uncharacterized protein K489DRAFT_1139 [Dissoconium aciculare CBS 342.82]KAF1826909.1 hypothetical protein K489DRAFT_1139 [Dissoconium aciculare CBS 342.82]